MGRVQSHSNTVAVVGVVAYRTQGSAIQAQPPGKTVGRNLEYTTGKRYHLGGMSVGGL